MRHHSLPIAGGQPRRLLHSPLGRRGALVCDEIGATKRDPTGTSTLRRRYESEMAARFRRVRGTARRLIVEMDGLGMRVATINQRLQGSGGLVVLPVAGPSGVGTRLADLVTRVSALVDLLHRSAQEEILGSPPGTPSRVAQLEPWQARHIRAAVAKGRRDARAKLARRRGQAEDAKRPKEPQPADSRAKILASRSYTELEGITDDMSRRIARELSRGVAAGQGPERIARRISKEIDLSLTRARTLVRTEVIGAHAEASLDQYQEADVLGVEVEAEFATADDDAVCEECADLEGEVFEIEEARGMIPVHPNCRCAFLPLVDSREEIDA